MSYLASVVEPSGTVTVGQNVTYSFSFTGPYPVYWTFYALGYSKSGISSDSSTVTISVIVPSNPNASRGSISFSNTNQGINSVYYLKPLDGFTEVVYPALSYLSTYQDPIVVTNNMAQILSVFAVPEISGFPITTACYPLVLSVTSQQIYPSLGSETTVFTHTFNTAADYTAQTYTTPNVVAGTVNRYKAYVTISGGSMFSADTGNTRASVSLISSTNAPILTLQPSALSLPNNVSGTMYNAGTIGIKYMSPSPPTIAWFRNGVQIPLGGNTYPSIVDPTLYPNYGGFDSSIALAIPNAWPGLVSSCANGDSYYCRITNANGTVTSNTVTLTMGALAVPDAVTAEITPSTPVVMAEGGTLSLNAVSTSNQPVTYQWKKDGVPIVGATASAYSVVNAPTSASGAYTVVATSGTAIHETPATQVTVKQPAYGVLDATGGSASANCVPIGSTITWKALGETEGMPNDQFSYYWEFDDGEVKIGNPVNKTATGLVSMYATVTATDLVTNTNATAQKSINLFDLSGLSTVFVWNDTGKSLTTASSGFSGVEGGRTFLYGNKLVSFGSNSYHQDVNVYNMDTDTLTLYSSVLPSGGFGGSCLIPAGPYTGKVLLFGNNSGVYGYWDLNANTYTQISATGGPGRNNNIYSVPSIALNNGNIMVLWHDYSYTYPMSIYNTSSNTFGSHGSVEYSPHIRQLNMLPSGNILCLRSGSGNYSVYDQLGLLKCNGTGGASLLNAEQFGISLLDKRFLQVGSLYANIFTEDTSLPSMGTWTTGVAAYPNAGQGGTSSLSSCLVITPGGDIFEVGGIDSSGVNINKTKMVFYSPSLNSFSIMTATQPVNGGGFTYYYSGRFWAIRSGDGRIFKSDLLGSC
jgi:hypothetical protein